MKDYSELEYHMELFDLLLGSEQSKNREIRYDYNVGRDSRPESFKAGREFFRVQITTRNSNHNPIRLSWFYHSDNKREKWYLSSISFRGLGLSIIEGALFHQLVSLRYLDLQGNKLISFDVADIQYLVNLHTINLSSNLISHISFEAIGHLKKLRYISLFNNQLNSIDLFKFKDLKGLNRLNLANNSITTVDLAPIGHLKYLKSIDLSSNKLSEISIPLRNTNLNTLLLNDNHIEVVRFNNSYLPMLNLLMISDNNISRVSLPYFLDKCPNLQRLYLWGNKLTNINWEILVDNKIEELNLNSNIIGECRLKGDLSRLKELELAYNRIIKLDLTMIDLKALEEINLSFNPLEYISLPPLLQLANLRLLDITGTSIDVLDLEVNSRINLIKKDFSIGNHKCESVHIGQLQILKPITTKIRINGKLQ